MLLGGLRDNEPTKLCSLEAEFSLLCFDRLHYLVRYESIRSDRSRFYLLRFSSLASSSGLFARFSSSPCFVGQFGGERPVFLASLLGFLLRSTGGRTSDN
jgi:hypothetical protein